MPHYKKMFDDKEHLYAFDLDGREVTIQIEKCFAGELMGEKGRKSKKPMLQFVGKAKKLALNRTNGKTIASLYGTDTDNWAGRWITIYPTTTDFGGETVDCIRVKPQVPQGKTGGGKSNGNGRNAKPPLEDQIREEMAKNAAPADELSDEDKRAIEAAEQQENG
jgi:hypothetical protein